MPPIPGLEYITGWLSELGFVHPSGMSISPIPASEIKSWSELSGYNVSPWQFDALRAMSKAYADQLSGDDKHSPRPWLSDSIDRDAVAEKLDRVLGSFKRPPKGSKPHG